jgi:hypothetical protein
MSVDTKLTGVAVTRTAETRGVALDADPGAARAAPSFPAAFEGDLTERDAVAWGEAVRVPGGAGYARLGSRRGFAGRGG